MGEMTKVEAVKKNYGGGSGEVRGYALEIRTTFPEPIQLSTGFIVGGEWRRLQCRILRCDQPERHDFQSGMVGLIPVFNYCHELDNLHLLNFEAAYALAIQTEAQERNCCLETRLVEVTVKYNYQANESSASEPISMSKIRRDYETQMHPPRIPAAPQEERKP